MDTSRIDPHKVTKPIQLLAAWLVGLVLTNTVFLAAAVKIGTTSVEGRLLVWAAVCNVPLFLVAIFVLQTRFRAELQEDSYYAEYLSKKTGSLIRIDRDASQDARISAIERSLEGRLDESVRASPGDSEEPPESSADLDWVRWRIALNLHHPQFTEISSALESAGIPVAEVFGTDKVPDRWVISINPALPSKHRAHLLRLLLPFDLEGFQLSSPERDAEEYEDVYIGSYLTSSFVPLSPAIKKVLDGPDAARRFDAFVSQRFKRAIYDFDA